MALIFKVLAKGTLGTTTATLGSAVPAGKAWIIKNISLVNTSTSGSRTVNLSAKKSTSGARSLIPYPTLLNAATATDSPAGSQLLLGFEIPMAAGDLIEGKASASSSVLFVVFGAERDL